MFATGLYTVPIYTNEENTKKVSKPPPNRTSLDWPIWPIYLIFQEYPNFEDTYLSNDFRG